MREEAIIDWSIQEIARLAGTTSRTLRHYGEVGLLEPSRIGSNGYRYYDERALARLQRILMLRDLGLGIPAIADVLEGNRDNGKALLGHLHWLQEEKNRLRRDGRRIVRARRDEGVRGEAPVAPRRLSSSAVP